ncbi:HotDog domain-containing protein [Panaeolus papilionaceus]|nr:HotDog domain-containing protein [Panaeolus papilionaceus]
MSSTRFQASTASTSSHVHDSPRPATPRLGTSSAWVDPASLPHYNHHSPIGGNAPDYVKQLNYNTFMSYGVGEDDCFGYKVGKAVKFVEVNINRKHERRGRLEATTIAEIQVTKHMLNGAGMLHGGCVAYLIDNLCSTPLVVLGLIQSVNGVGVTQSMNVLFHSPAPLGTCLQIVSTSVSLGGRVMSARCELLDKDTGRIVASSVLNKMQPALSKL